MTSLRHDFLKAAVLVVLTLNPACTKPGKEIAPPPSTQNSAERRVISGPSPVGGSCPAGIGASAGDHPVVTLELPEKRRILVCGHEDDAKQEGLKKQLSEFEIYSVNSHGELSKSLLTAGALDNYLVYPESEKLVLDELMYSHDRWVPIFRSRIDCVGESCGRSTPVCLFKKSGATSDSEGQQQLKDTLRRVQKSEAVGEVDIWALFDASLSGDAKAAKVLEKSDLKVDAASAEALTQAKTLLKRLSACS
ncbi:MAG: hypothetical protein H7222_07265 [Methylotenera sp.]|nr:hypothetical protein [Oligoflexia bacterium]